MTYVCTLAVASTSLVPDRGATQHPHIPRGRNQLHTIFDRHLQEFCDVYVDRYAAKYGMFRLDRVGHCRDRPRFLPAERSLLFAET